MSAVEVIGALVLGRLIVLRGYKHKQKVTGPDSEAQGLMPLAIGNSWIYSA